MTTKGNLPQTRQTILSKLLLCIAIPQLVSLQLGPQLLLQSTTMLCQQFLLLIWCNKWLFSFI